MLHKYKAFDKIDKTIHNVKIIDYNSGTVELYTAPGSETKIRIFDEIKMLLFTGGYDKHGNEVYTGHIMQGPYPYDKNYYAVIEIEDNPHTIHHFLMTCRKRPGADCTGISDGIAGTLDDDDLNDMEVVGNIYENLELIL